MQNYQPYHLLADTSETLHLIFPRKRKNFFLFKYTVFPVVLLIVWLFMLFKTGKNIPMGFNYLAAIIIVALSFSLLLHKYVTEIKITDANISFSGKRFLFNTHINIAIKEVTKIMLTKNHLLIFETKYDKYVVKNVANCFARKDSMGIFCNKLENITTITITK